MNELSSLSGIVGKRKREEEQLSTLSSVKTRGNTPYESRPLGENHVRFAWTKRISFSCETGDEQRTNQETRIRKNASRWRLIKTTSITHFSCPFASMHRDRFTSLLIAAVVVDGCRSQTIFFIHANRSPKEQHLQLPLIVNHIPLISNRLHTRYQRNVTIQDKRGTSKQTKKNDILKRH